MLPGSTTLTQVCRSTGSIHGQSRGSSGVLQARLARFGAVLSRLLGLVLCLLLALPLSACGGGQPPQKVLLSALALQIELTQRSIASALALDPGAAAPQVSRVRVESQEQLPIGEGSGLHLTGRFDWRLSDDPIRVDSRFDLYLQRGERGQAQEHAAPTAALDDELGQEGQHRPA